MSDNPHADSSAPVPIRPSEPPAPPDAVVNDLRASLRATDVYVRLLIDRVELSCVSDRVRLDGVPADALVRLTAASAALQREADRTLDCIDRGLARAAHVVADLAEQSVYAGDGHDE